MFCSHCGEKIDQESVFCPNCGKKVEGVSPAHPPKKKGARQVVIIGTLAVFLIGLVSGGYILFFKADPPEKVVIRALKALEKGDAEESLKFFSERLKREIQREIQREARASGISLEEAIKEAAEEIRKGGKGIKEIKIKKKNTMGREAVVEFSMIFLNGHIEKGLAKLIKENGKWKIKEIQD
ncbi:MAG: zinc-ribbon domain-containing protein [Candidatus Aminicenantia bacterium]